MKILPITQAENKYIYNKNKTNLSAHNIQQDNFNIPCYYPLNFKAKKVNIALEKEKLLRQLNEILKKDIPEESEDDMILRLTDAVSRFIANKFKKLERIDSQANIIYNSTSLTEIQKYEFLNKLKREYSRIQKQLPDYMEKQADDEKTDFLLINKLKSAILNGKYDLKKVFISHYSKLNDISTAEELKSTYPYIPLPQPPEKVIAAKIAKNQNKEFYTFFDECKENGNVDLLEDYLTQEFPKILLSAFAKNKPTDTELIERLYMAMGKEMIKRYESIKQKDMFDSLPIKIKQKSPIITDEEIKLLSLDYDDYILNVIREIYLNHKKPNEIIYSDGKTTLNLSKIQDSAYKFERFPEKYKQFIKMAENIKQAERTYENFSEEEFKQRMLFYTDLMGENEELLEKMVEFDSSMFTIEDKIQLAKMLRKLDMVFDEEMTLKDAIFEIHKENIKPTGTVRINETKRSEAIQKFKEEQKTAAKLRAIQEEFDNAINFLYENNLNYSAELASLYRPVTIDNAGENYKFIIEIIKKYSGNKDNISNLNKEIVYWNKYIESKKNNLDGVTKAEEYATLKDGTIDKIKAGKYLFNKSLVESYDDNKNLQSNVGNMIMSIAQGDKAIEYFCKYDDYKMTVQNKGSSINTLLNIFDEKSDKQFLKYLIIQDYIKNPTTGTVTQSGMKPITASITPKAKQEIYDYYRFPKCIELFSAFEDAMSKFATTKASSGIKKLGRNNDSLSNVYELKIIGYKDRLISYDGTYVFDEFSPVGRH